MMTPHAMRCIDLSAQRIESLPHEFAAQAFIANFLHAHHTQIHPNLRRLRCDLRRNTPHPSKEHRSSVAEAQVAFARFMTRVQQMRAMVLLAMNPLMGEVHCGCAL